MQFLLVVLCGVYFTLGYNTLNNTFCPVECDGMMDRGTCFQNANNKSYCLCTANDVCRGFTKCENMTDEVLNDSDTLSGSKTVLSNISSICFIRSTCPADFTDNITRILCEVTTATLVSYDMFPVQVKENGFPNINYKNKYCAMCNGKLNYTTWNIGVDLHTCDILNIHQPPNVDPLMYLALVPGCQVFPVELDPVCAVCEYPNSVIFLEGFPVLSALFKFSSRKEQMPKDKLVESNCGKNKMPSNSPEANSMCGSGEAFVAGVCQKIFIYTQGIYEFRFYKQILHTVTKDEALELTRKYITFVQGTAINRLDSDTTLIKKWDVKVYHGQTVTDDQCVELQLSIIVEVGDRKVDESTLRDALIPCSSDSTSRICFVPADSSQRDSFCQISQCHEIETNEQYRSLEWNVQSFITFASLMLSVFSLLISVCIFLKCPLFHNLPGRINLCLMVSLLCSQLLYSSSVLVYNLPLACHVIGVVTHYSWLCSFAWMSICAFHTWFTFGRRDISRSMRASENKFYLKRYCLSAMLLPFLVVLSCVIIDLLSPGITMGYGKSICFITDPIGITLGFASPVGLSLLVNLILFVATIVNIQRGPKIVNDIRSTGAFFFIYAKLSSLMGFTWICAYIAELVGVSWLDTVSTIVNGLQGVFICVSFVCNKRVYNWIQRFACRQ